MRSITPFNRHFQPVSNGLTQFHAALEDKLLVLLENYVELTLFISLVTPFSKVQAVAQSRPSLSIEEAKNNLERLQQQILSLGREDLSEIEREIARQVNTAPKGEFETTREYEARIARAGELRQQIRDRINREEQERRDNLNRQINQLLVLEFTLPFEAELGIYDADTQRLPLVILPGRSSESLYVPRSEARDLKENFSQAESVGVFRFLLDAEGRAREYLISGRINYQGKSYQLENREMNVERAMLILYGNYSSRNIHSLTVNIIVQMRIKGRNSLVLKTKGL